MEQNDQNNSGNTAGEQTDAGSFGGGNEGTQQATDGPLGDMKSPAGSESVTGGSGESGTIGGPHGGADDIGRSGTGSAMTGQTSILSDED